MSDPDKGKKDPEVSIGTTEYPFYHVKIKTEEEPKEDDKEE